MQKNKHVQAIVGVFLLAVSLGFSITGSSQSDNDSIFIRRMANEILDNGKAYANLYELTKKIGQRLSGSPGMYKAEEWGLKKMKEYGAHLSYKQQCMVPHWERAGKDEAMILVDNVKSPLKVAALGNAVGTGLPGIKAPVIVVNSFDDLELKKDDLKGKIIFYNYKFKNTNVRTFESYGDAVKYRGQGASRAARYGALAVIVRSMSHSVDNYPHTGSLHYNDSMPSIPAFAIGLRDADWLAAYPVKGAIMQLVSHCAFFADTVGHNIIGELIGSEKPDEIITVGGHLDSWDLGEGAHDDGAGMVQTMEVLRTFTALGYKPKHTIRFVLFANEENGLRGGTQYAKVAKDKNEKHIFALESDAGGFTPRGFGFTISNEKFKKIEPWSQLLKEYGAGDFFIGGGGADIGPLKEAFGTVLAGLSPDSQRYFDVHHAASDVFENVNKRELELGAVNMAALLYLVDTYGL